MRLLGKPAGFIIWEIRGPQDGFNRWSDGVNAVLVAPSVDIWLTAAAPTAVQLYTNTTPLVRTGNNYGPVTTPAHDRLNPTPGVTETAVSPNPINMGEGVMPDPSGWATLGPAVVGGTVMPINVAVAVAAAGAPTWLRLVLTVPGDGYVKMQSKWS